MARIFYKNKEVGNTQNIYQDLIGRPSINENDVMTSNTSETLGITWYGSQAEYDALPEINPNTIYIISDNTYYGSTKVNYKTLEHKPAINGITLFEDSTYEDLNLMTKTQIEAKLSSVFTYKGTIPTLADLPKLPAVGSVYFVTEENGSFAFNGVGWDSLGSTFDLTTYQKIEDDTFTTASKTVPGAINELNNNVGDVTTLSTTNKTSVVEATNEVKSMFGRVKKIEVVEELPVTPEEDVMYVIIVGD